MFKVFFAVLFVFLPCVISAQVAPADGAKLHYRIIGFAFPAENQVTEYAVEIAKGGYESSEVFLKNKVGSYSSRENRVIGEVPDFGADYTWRVLVTKQGKKEQIGSFHHFATGMIKNVDTAFFRLKIRQPTAKYKDAFVFMDKNGVLYNMAGKPVWYLPGLPNVPIENITVRDMKITPQGTITFLNGTAAYEISYNGDLLWQAPDRGEMSGENTEHYHHEFTKLTNGHYMILGNESVLCKSSADINQLPEIAGTGGEPLGGTAMIKQVFGTLLEYDSDKRLVWSWRTSGFFKKAEMYWHMSKIRPELFDLHENSFFFSEKTRKIYLGLKNINQVYRIAYPAGNVERVYGKNERSEASDLFSMHHACKLSGKGLIYLFNNNVYDLGGVPGVVVLQEPGAPGQQLKKVWEFHLPAGELATVDAARPNGAGGNVMELRDDDMFVSMCDPFGNLFIVNRAKKLLWSAVLEGRDQTSENWMPSTQYRGSVVADTKLLNSMIWHK